jgi:hypothetical protein
MANTEVVSAWECNPCDAKGYAKGYKAGEQPPCIECGQPATVTARPTVNIEPGTAPTKIFELPQAAPLFVRNSARRAPRSL